jgi:hypothetical protein
MAPVYKTEIHSRVTHCTDHATPLCPQQLALTSRTSGGRSVGIVRLRTESHEDCFFVFIMGKTESTWYVGQCVACCTSPGWCGAVGGMSDREKRGTRSKPALSPLCPPQIPHMIRARTQAAVVGSQRLATWAMARPKHLLVPAARIDIANVSLHHDTSFNQFGAEIAHELSIRSDALHIDNCQKTDWTFRETQAMFSWFTWATRHLPLKQQCWCCISPGSSARTAGWKTAAPSALEQTFLRSSRRR